MKRIVTIVFFVCCTLCVSAQFQRGDTLLMGQRWPTYYYWGDNWVDSHLDVGGYVGTYVISLPWCKPEYARYIYADSSLRVIGIAAGLQFRVIKDQYYIEYIGDVDPFRNYQTEYFRLWEVDSTTNEMILIAEKPLNDTSVACYLPNDDTQPMFGRKPKGIPVREVYFDSAITVYDSFYVSVTANNNWRRANPDFFCYFNTQLIGAWIHSTKDVLVYPQPNHYRRKLHLVNDFDYDPSFGITDTNWHVLHTTRASTSDDPNSFLEWGFFMMVFPILDTSSDQSWVPVCKSPTSLKTVHVGKEVVVLAWESEGSEFWELKIAKENENIDSVASVTCNNDVMPVYDLDTACWYVAKVRSVCGENRISEWSDTIRFLVPGDTTATTDPNEGIESAAERYTILMPNPASEQVTVISSFRIDRVEIYTLTGQRVKQEKVGAISTYIDISGLSKGTYIVRIHTNHGVSNKRLVVR